MRKTYHLACILFLAFSVIVSPARAIEQTKDNWMDVVDGFTYGPTYFDVLIRECTEKRDPTFRSEVGRLTKQHLSETEHQEIMKEYDRVYERNLRSFKKYAKNPDYRCKDEAIKISLNSVAGENLKAGQLGHAKFLHVVERVEKEKEQESAKKSASQGRAAKLAGVKPDSMKPREGASHMTFWQADCAQGNIDKTILDRFNGDFEVSGHDIAEAYIEKYRLQNWPTAFEQAWPYMLQHPDDADKGVEAYLNSLDKAELAQWDQNSREVFRAEIGDTLNMYKAIEVFESLNPPPHQIAYMKSANWSDEYFTRQEYIERSTNYAKEFQQNEPGISPYVAGLKAAVMMDEVDIRQKRGFDPRPQAIKELPSLTRLDLKLRRQMLKIQNPALYEAKDWNGNNIMHSYWTDRPYVYACLKHRKMNYQTLDTLGSDKVAVLALKKDGQWCGTNVTIHVKTEDPAFYLGKGIQKLADKISDEIEKQCPAVQEILLSGYVEDGEAEILNNRSSKSSGWRGLDNQPNKAQTVFLKSLESAFDGDVAAQREIGAAFLTGTGTTKNERRAEHWLKQAAENGNSLAQAEYAWILSKLRKTAYEDAVGWANKSAEQGDPVGHFNRGRLQAPWYSGERFADLIVNSNPIVPMFAATIDMELAEKACEQAPYKNDSRYTGYCETIKRHNELLTKAAGGGSGGAGCDPETDLFVAGCGGGMNAFEAQTLMGATGGPF